MSVIQKQQDNASAGLVCFDEILNERKKIAYDAGSKPDSYSCPACGSEAAKYQAACRNCRILLR